MAWVTWGWSLGLVTGWSMRCVGVTASHGGAAGRLEQRRSIAIRVPLGDVLAYVVTSGEERSPEFHGRIVVAGADACQGRGDGRFGPIVEPERTEPLQEIEGDRGVQMNQRVPAARAAGGDGGLEAGEAGAALERMLTD